MAKRRVVVTGMGAVTPIGLSVDEFWQNVKAQKTGFSEITKFDTTNYKCKLAAEVKEFDAKNYMDAKEARRMELFSQYAVAAAKEAIEDAGLEMDQEDPYMAGCAIGSGVGSLQAIEREHTRLTEKGPGRVGPLFVPMMISNMAAGNVSIHFGLKGKSINVVTACATGTNTIGEAFRAIQYGEADIMVSGGTEGSICPTAIAGFTSLTALTAETDPERCSIPFDKERSGFVMGEGAAILILEDLLQCSAVRQDFFGCRIDPLALRCQPHPAACVTIQQAGGQSRLQCRQMCADGGLAEEQGLRCLCKAPQFRHGHEYLDLFQAEFAHVCLLAA